MFRRAECANFPANGLDGTHMSSTPHLCLSNSTGSADPPAVTSESLQRNLMMPFLEVVQEAALDAAVVPGEGGDC